MRDLIIASQLPEALNTRIAARTGAEVITLAPGEPIEEVRGADILLASPPRMSEYCAVAAPADWPCGLHWVHVVSSGLDGYPAWLFEAPRASFSPGATAVPLAEFALAAILAKAKQLPELWISSPADWSIRELTRVDGSVLGIFGCGAIGTALATRALALGMKVIATRRSDRPLPAGVARANDIGELFAVSDHVVLAAAANSSTRHIADTATLARARPGLHLINVSRGTLIDDAALITALDDGRLSRATLDVAHLEPLPADHPFYTHPKVRISPHTAAITGDVMDVVADIFAVEFARFADGRPPLNPVPA